MDRSSAGWVRSTITTASASCASIPPVYATAASPGASRAAASTPVAMSAITSKKAGRLSDAPKVSLGTHRVAVHRRPGKLGQVFWGPDLLRYDPSGRRCRSNCLNVSDRREVRFQVLERPPRRTNVEELWQRFILLRSAGGLDWTTPAPVPGESDVHGPPTTPRTGTNGLSQNHQDLSFPSPQSSPIKPLSSRSRKSCSSAQHF